MEKKTYYLGQPHFLLEQEGIDISACDAKGNNALFWAAAYHYFPICRTLISRAKKHLPVDELKLFINKKGQNGFFPLMDIINDSNRKFLSFYLGSLEEAYDEDFDGLVQVLTLKTLYKYNILHDLCKKGNTSALKNIFGLLRHLSFTHGDRVIHWINQINSSGETPLLIAIRSDSPDLIIVRELLQAGANPNVLHDKDLVMESLTKAEESDHPEKRRIYAEIFLLLVAHPAINPETLPEFSCIKGKPLWRKNLPDMEGRFNQIINKKNTLSENDYTQFYFEGEPPDIFWNSRGLDSRELECRGKNETTSQNAITIQESLANAASLTEIRPILNLSILHGHKEDFKLAVEKAKSMTSKKDFSFLLQSLLRKTLDRTSPEPAIVHILLEEGAVPDNKHMIAILKQAQKEKNYLLKILRCTVALDLLAHPAIDPSSLQTELSSWCRNVPDIQKHIMASLEKREERIKDQENKNSPSPILHP